MERFRHQTKLSPSPTAIMPLRLVTLLLVLTAVAGAQDKQNEEELEAAKKEQAFQAWMDSIRDEMMEYRDAAESESAEELQINFSKFWTSPYWQEMSRVIFEAHWVHSSFGLAWDDIPPPTIRGTNATETIDAFIAENGWNMLTNYYPTLSPNVRDQGKPIRGLPWEVIQDRTFTAATYQGILYIPLRGAYRDSSGLAYNPNTNRFRQSKRTALKHIGDHWYVWVQTEFPIALPSFYEGDALESEDPENEANESQPSASEPNPPSSEDSDR